MTDAEKYLWRALRDRQVGGMKFRRQHPIGPFIADFACIEKQIVIEADGGQPSDSAGDERRTAWLEKRGWIVIRFWNNDVLQNQEGVQSQILLSAQSRHSRFLCRARLQ